MLWIVWMTDATASQLDICKFILNERFQGNPLHSLTHVRSGYERIPAEHFSDYTFQSNVDGELIRVHFLPDAKLASAHPALPPNPEELKLLVEDWMEVQGYSSTTRDMIRQITLDQAKDPKFAKTLARDIEVAQAKNKSAALGMGSSPPKAIGNASEQKSVGIFSGPGIPLSNTGIERFFWFTPEGESQLTAARVLDIHRHPDKKVSVLVEYLSGSSGSERVRHVAEAKLSEFKTAQVNESIFSREHAYREFLEDLTPNEAWAKKMAQAKGLKLYGYTDFRRIAQAEGRQTLSDPLTPMQMMNLGIDLAMEKSTMDRFGSLESIFKMGPSAFATNNMIEAFARLNPQFVLENFSAKGFEYTWVIVEDGGLKIIPKMAAGNNLKPQLIRAAGGRRIYAGGDFIINDDGTLRVRTDTNAYQDVNHDRFGARGAYADGNPNLNQFIHDVFAHQAKAKVSNLESGMAWSFGTRKGNDFYSGNYHEETNFNSTGPGVEPTEYVTWKPDEGELPLSFEDWAKKAGVPAKGPSKITWAHYVLNSNPNMKLSEIQKERYRPLAKKFHPDLNPGKDTVEIQKIVNDAMDEIRKAME